MKVGFEEKLDYISKISEYAPLFVIEDKPDLFKNWTSLTALKPESCVLGLNSGKDLSVISYAMIVDKMPMVLIIGGDLTPFKLLAIDSVLNIVDEIWLVGKIGMYFRMYLERLDQFCGLRLDELKKKIIEKIYKNINDMNNLKLMPKSLNPDLKISKISIPCDVFYTDLSNENDKFELPEVESPEFIDFVKNRKIYHNFMKEQEIKDFEEKETELCLLEDQEKELKKKEKRMKEDQEEEYEEKNEEEPKKNTYIQEINNELVKETLETQPIENNLEETKEQPKELQKENQYFLDFGSFTQRKLIRSIKNCKKVVWIESLCPNDNENFNETNIEIAKYLCAYQEEKKNMIQKEMQTEGLHNFNEDRIVFTVGKNLEQKLNSFDLIDPADIKPTSPKDENEENKSQAFELIEKNEENKSEISGQGNTTQQKKNNIVLVSDFHAKDSDFICKIISGRYPYGNFYKRKNSSVYYLFL